MTDAAKFEEFAILELFGHRKLAGKVSEAAWPHGFVRLDIPKKPELYRPNGELIPAEWHATQFYAPSAVYCITPCTEDIARAFAEKHSPHPVTRWELPAHEEPFHAGLDVERDDDPDDEAAL